MLRTLAFTAAVLVAALVALASLRSVAASSARTASRSAFSAAKAVSRVFTESARCSAPRVRSLILVLSAWLDSSRSVRVCFSLASVPAINSALARECSALALARAREFSNCRIFDRLSSEVRAWSSASCRSRPVFSEVRVKFRFLDSSRLIWICASLAARSATCFPRSVSDFSSVTCCLSVEFSF